MTETVDGCYMCPDCLEDGYVQCHCCGRCVRADDTCSAIGDGGYNVSICESCRDNCCVRCEDCETLIYEDNVEVAYDEHGHKHFVGPCCMDNYQMCEDCGRLFRSELLDDDLRPECAGKIANNDELQEVRKEIA